MAAAADGGHSGGCFAERELAVVNPRPESRRHFTLGGASRAAPPPCGRIA